MNLLNKITAGSVPSGLPTLDGVENWGLVVVAQVIGLFVFFLIAKHLARFKIGGIIMTCVVGGIATFVVQNWSQVSGWIEAFIDTF
ncbi:hypothetical protein [Bacillus sp. JCM 19041]|uniref:hypothetical protein n=1 Tax=Bacillus sp. JCM 19041 TaxID=1460637 RepID=UPI0006D1B86B